MMAKLLELRNNKKAMNYVKFGLLIVLVLALIAIYMTINVNFSNSKYYLYSFKTRYPKVIAIILASFAIGGASLVFQSIINNRIVTPCLLGMNSLYTLLHTLLAFFVGTSSVLMTNRNLSFGIDLVTMAIVATIVYGLIFKLTKYNVLYILLIGTVLTSFFSSIQNTLIRVMDPNEYETLQGTLVASFSKVNSAILIFAACALVGVALLLFKDLRNLNVITLGKNQAINLGVDYDKSILRLLIGVTLYIAVATALVGPISFLGLIIANLSRQVFKTYKHSQLILGSFLFGMVVLLLGQLLVEHVFSYAIPVSTFVTFGGGIYFLYLILKGKTV